MRVHAGQLQHPAQSVGGRPAAAVDGAGLRCARRDPQVRTPARHSCSCAHHHHHHHHMCYISWLCAAASQLLYCRACVACTLPQRVHRLALSAHVVGRSHAAANTVRHGHAADTPPLAFAFVCAFCLCVACSWTRRARASCRTSRERCAATMPYHTIPCCNTWCTHARTLHAHEPHPCAG